MIYDPLLKYSHEMMILTCLPNIHPQSIDCIIRSEQLSRGSLYVSNLEAVENLETLSKLKASSILTCVEGCRLDYPLQIVPIYGYFPLFQNLQFNLNSYFQAVALFVKQSLAKTNCIIHCLTGQSKSVAVVLAYLIRWRKMTFNDSYDYVQKKRKLINLDTKCIKALKQFENFLNKDKFYSSVQDNKDKQKTITYKTSKTQNFIDYQRDKSKLFVPNDKSRVVTTSKISQSKQSQVSYCSNSRISHNNAIIQSQASCMSMKNSKPREQNQSSEIHSQKRKATQSRVSERKSKIIAEQKQRQNQVSNGKQEFQVCHKEPLQFQRLMSSRQQEYIGVKRQLKSSSTAFKKQKQNALMNQTQHFQTQNNFLGHQQQNLSYLRVQRAHSQRSQIKLQNKTQKSQMISQRKSHNRSTSQVNSGRNKTNKSQFQAKKSRSYMKINPQTQGYQEYSPIINIPKQKLRVKSKCSAISLSIRKTQNQQQLDLSMILSPAFNRSPSKKQHFSNLNQQLNLNVKQIVNKYDNEISDLRLKYQDKLRKLNRKKDNQGIMVNNVKLVQKN